MAGSKTPSMLRLCGTPMIESYLDLQEVGGTATQLEVQIKPRRTVRPPRVIEPNTGPRTSVTARRAER